MKIEKEQLNSKELRDVKTDECFMAARSGRYKDEIGYYLKLDIAKPSSLFKFCSSPNPCIAAINLETGFVRFFTGKEVEQTVRIIEPTIEFY